MKIRVKRLLVDSIPCVILSTEDWGKQDLDSMLRFGEPFVEIGGRFYKSGCRHDGPENPEDSTDLPDCESFVETDEYFDMPCKEKGIRSGFPVMIKFTAEHFEDPMACAAIWAEELPRRITHQVKWLRNLSCISKKEEVYEV